MIQNPWLLKAKRKTVKEELTRCNKDFTYFAKNYLKFGTPNKKLELHPFHERLIDHFQSNRFSVVTKFRQGGFLTYTAAFMLWQCLLKLDKRIMFFSKTDAEAVLIGQMIQDWVNNMPDWLQPDQGKWNSHIKEFKDTGASMHFHTPEAACGKAIDWLVIDEPAFIPNMEAHWKAVWPTLSCGGGCIAVGTVYKKYDDEERTKKNWFYDLHQRAFSGLNNFAIFDVNYKEHPHYADPEWCKILRSRLGEEGWKQEIEMDFLD